MIYLDTSALAPLVIAEAESDAMEARLRRIKPGELVTSQWAQVEMASLVARKLRMNELTEAQAEAVRHQFSLVLDESFELLTPDRTDYATASEYLAVPRTGLRAGDALHLAVAANRGMKGILTQDRGFLKAGKLLGLPVALAVA